VLAVELLCAAQAVDLRADIGLPAAGVVAAWEAIRANVAPMNVDREITGQLQWVERHLEDVLAAAATAVGPLS
jgi:histidine ammonia-lyase